MEENTPHISLHSKQIALAACAETSRRVITRLHIPQSMKDELYGITYVKFAEKIEKDGSLADAFIQSPALIHTATMNIFKDYQRSEKARMDRLASLTQDAPGHEPGYNRVDAKDVILRMVTPAMWRYLRHKERGRTDERLVADKLATRAEIARYKKVIEEVCKILRI